MLAGNILYSACQWSIVIVLAKLGSTEQVGEYALGLAISVPLILFANLQLRSLVASDLTDRFRSYEYLTFRLISLGVALILVAGIAMLTAGTRERAQIIVVVGAAQALEVCSETFYGFMQRQNRMDRIAGSLMFRGPLALAALWIAMRLTHDLLWALTALALGRLFVLLVWDVPLGFPEAYSSVRLRGHWGGLAILFRFALPLGVISVIASVTANIPRYFIQGQRGTAELGIYSALASLLSVGTLVVSAYGQTIFVPVARAFTTFDRSGFRRFTFLTIAIGAVLGGLAILISYFFGEAILSRLFRPAYAQHVGLLIRLMVAGTVNVICSGLGFVMTAAGCLRPQVPLLAVTGIVAAGASAWMIPKYGLDGAASAVLVAAVVQLLGTFVILVRLNDHFTNRCEISTGSENNAATVGAEAT
jgi:O-antigen/teichoic acid export membrane protein